MTETAIIFGGSGFIGTHLVRRLAAENKINIVSADLRPPRERLPDIEYRIVDVRSLDDFEVPKNTSIIYNLAAVHATPGHPPWEYYDTNVLGAIEITQLAIRGGIDEIVFTSSISVYGPDEKAKTEQTVTAPVSDYGRSKLMAERIHSAWAKLATSRRLTIVRPAVVFGAGEGGNFTRMAKLLRTGFFIFPGRRDTIKACIYVEDLIDTIELARSEDNGYVLFNAAFPGRYSIENIVETLRSEYFPRALTFQIPERLVNLAVRFLHIVGGDRSGFHPDRVAKLVRSTDVRPAWLTEHGWSPEDPLKKALKHWATLSNGKFE